MKKKNKIAFWKRQSPEITRITNHIGNIINNGHAVDYFLNGSLALMGIYSFKDIRGAVLGPLGLKLAQSGNLAAGGVGLGILGLLGLTTFAPSALDIFDPDKVKEYQEKIKPPENNECKSGFTKMINFGQILCVSDDFVKFYQYRGWEKYTDYLNRIS